MSSVYHINTNSFTHSSFLPKINTITNKTTTISGFIINNYSSIFNTNSSGTTATTGSVTASYGSIARCNTPRYSSCRVATATV